MLVVVLHFIFDLHFILLLYLHLSFFFIHICAFLCHLYRRIFTPILYFQLSPSQSNWEQLHFQLFRYLLTASATAMRGHFLPTGGFYFALIHGYFNLRLSRLPLGAGSSSLKFAGLHTDPWNTDPAHLFVWFTVIHNLHIQNDSVLNSTIYYHELLVVKV